MLGPICNVWTTGVFQKLLVPNKGEVTLLHPGTRFWWNIILSFFSSAAVFH